MTPTEKRVFFGAGAGALAGAALWFSGVPTILHEAVGHCGIARLVYNYAPGSAPTWRAGPWENMKALFKGGNRIEVAKRYFTQLDGVAWVHAGKPNALGRFLGTDGRRALISIGGSLPQLGLDGAMMVGGVQLNREETSQSGWFLIGFALISHIYNSIYSWDAVYRLGLNAKAAGGHDFVNFAKRMSNMTGMPPFAVASSTATLWLASVPAVGYTAHNVSKVE